jgi:hypothetical protein
MERNCTSILDRKRIPPPTTCINEPVRHRELITELLDLEGMRGIIMIIVGELRDDIDAIRYLIIST